MNTLTFYDPAYENDMEALKVLQLIVYEFDTDPRSVQCFDLRTVARAKKVIDTRVEMEKKGDLPPVLTEGRKHELR